MSARVLIRNIRLPIAVPESEALHIARGRLLTRCGEPLSSAVYKRAVDARHRGALAFVYTVINEYSNVPDDAALTAADGVLTAEAASGADRRGDAVLEGRPVVVGFGPAGMFCSLLLAEAGLCPIVLERGGDVSERIEKTRRFYTDGVLDPECNVQFGAGGAGTFSDGKLTTRIGDPRCRWVLERFVEFGAPVEILREAKPHIGTDRLTTVVGALRDRINALGGEVRFNTRYERSVLSGGRVTGIVTGNGDTVSCGALILATGHSARDTYVSLTEQGFELRPKPFSVGVRIEQLQADIDRFAYGAEAGNPLLPHSDYAFSRRLDGRAVYTFCMCPGGEVVAAASEDGGVVTNGMSRFARDGKNANSALVVSVEPLSPVEFQRGIERRAAVAGGGGYYAPVETVASFLRGGAPGTPSRIMPTYRNGCVREASLSALFEPGVTDMLKLGLRSFGASMSVFAPPDAPLTGAETRTSSPYRLTRGDAFTAIGFDNVYPCGEGAGYAGGIASSAVDGVACASEILARFGSVRL